jgi:hypothetical protein
MKDYSDYPPEYLAHRWREWVFMVTGTAVIRAQYVEQVLTAICFLLGTQGLRFSKDDFLSGDSSRTRQTLGMIERQLRNTKLFGPDLASAFRYSRDVATESCMVYSRTAFRLSLK